MPRGPQDSKPPVHIRIHLLGAFTASVDGAALDTPPTRVQALLAALLLQPRPWQRTHLAGRLFPDTSERRARQRLSHTLWQARQWLPDLPLEASPETIALPEGTVWCDLHAFNAVATSDRLDDWLRALALYGGDLVDGVYDDWLLEEREALYLRAIDLSHRACDRLWQAGRVETLLPIAERLVQREPLDERALRTLMRAYQALGRRGAALAAYERCAADLRREVGVAPAPATRALAEAVATATTVAAGLRSTAWRSRRLGQGPAPALPEDLLQLARHALCRGHAARVRGCLDQVRNRSQIDAQAWHRVALDLALLIGDYEQAAGLMAEIERAAWTPADHLRAARIALGRQDAVRARDQAAELLMTVHDPGTGESDGGATPEAVEVDALLVLAEAQQQLGDWDYASQGIERARLLAHRRGDPRGIARALLLQASRRVHQGRYEGAGACYREAQAVLLEAGLHPSDDLAAALQGLRLVQTHTNDLRQALLTLEEELAMWRDLGLPRQEAAALEGRALIENHLGRSAASLATMQQALGLSRRLGDPVRIGISLYNLAASRIYHDDALAPEAADDAREALAIFSAHRLPHWEAAAWSILGYVLWVAGRYGSALAYLRDAHAARERLGELAFIPELLAYQALAHLGLGEAGDALALTQRAMLLLAHGGVSQEVVPDVFYAHAVALAANGDEANAERYLRQAYARLLDGAASFEDEAARQAFFHRNPTTRRLMRELQRRSLAPPVGDGVQTVQVAGARGGTLRVAWTVDAGPGDVALERAEGAVALRRTRVARLLAEAHAQGARPTVADLATALGVSARTIQRDLAALRAEADVDTASLDRATPA